MVVLLSVYAASILKSHILIGNYVIFTLAHVYGFAARKSHRLFSTAVLFFSLCTIHSFAHSTLQLQQLSIRIHSKSHALAAIQ